MKIIIVRENNQTIDLIEEAKAKAAEAKELARKNSRVRKMRAGLKRFVRNHL